MNYKNLIISILFILIGIFLIRYALVRPCEIGSVTQTVQGEQIIVNQPHEMDRLICLSTDYFAIIPFLFGTAMIFPGISGLYRSITENAENKKSKKKSKK